MAGSLQQVAAVLGKDRCIQYLKRCDGMPLAAWVSVRPPAVTANAQLSASASGMLLGVADWSAADEVQCSLCEAPSPCSWTVFARPCRPFLNLLGDECQAVRSEIVKSLSACLQHFLVSFRHFSETHMSNLPRSIMQIASSRLPAACLTASG